jgi:hypothetical protein
MVKNALAAWLLTSAVLLGNDGSAKATPTGGIQLTREARISMEKERLTIGTGRVAVEYEFLNTTDRDITTEVAFPVPAYDIGSRFSPSAPVELSGWHVWVEGKELKYETEVKAVVNGVDQAALLRRLSIDIVSFGHFDQRPDGQIVSEIQKLPKAQQEELTRAGLVSDGVPAWTALKTYHWQQMVPAHRILHVKHEYTPELGLEHLDLANLQGKTEEPYAKLSDSCVDPGLRQTLIAAVPNDNGFGGGGFINPVWVDYTLTTANTWKTPIKGFELVIEKPKPTRHEQYYVSLCWDGRLERVGPDRFVAREENFVPKRELRVMFFQVGN